METLSYEHGIAPVPLLGQTIGENLRATVKHFPDNDALVVCSQNRRFTYHEFWDEVTACARRPARAGRGDRRPRRHLVAESVRVGHRSVCHGPHRRHSRQRQPRLPGSGAGVRPEPVRHRHPVARAAASDSSIMSPCSAPSAPAAPPSAKACCSIRSGMNCWPAARPCPWLISRHGKRRFSSMIRSTFSTPPARPAFRRARRSRTTTS